MDFKRKLDLIENCSFSKLFFIIIILFFSCEKRNQSISDDLLVKIKLLETAFLNTLDTNMTLAYDLADSLRNLSESHSPYRKGRANRFYGLTAMQLGHFEKASKAFYIAMQNQTKIYPNEKIYLMQNIAALHELKGQPDSALLYHDRAVGLLKYTPEYPYRGDLYETKAIALMNLGLFGQAQESYINALAEYELNEDTLSIAHVYGNMGINFAKRSKLDSAILCYNQSLLLAQEITDEDMIYKAQLNKASAMLSSGLNEQALELVQSSKKAAVQDDDSLAYFSLLGLELSVLNESNYVPESEELLKESRKMAIRLNSPSTFLEHLENEALYWSSQDSLVPLLEITLEMINFYNAHDQTFNQAPAAQVIALFASKIENSNSLNESIQEKLNELSVSIKKLWTNYTFDIIDNINKERINYIICRNHKLSIPCTKHLESAYNLMSKRLEKVLAENNNKVDLIENLYLTRLSELEKSKQLVIVKNKNQRLSHFTIILVLILILFIMATGYILKTGKSIKNKNEIISLQHNEIKKKNELIKIELEEKKRLLVKESLYKENFLNIKEAFYELNKTVDPTLRVNLNYKILQRKIKELATREEESMLLHFTDLDGAIIKKALEINAKLTKNDLKHLAYIKLNLSSKEVAEMMGVHTKTVDMARYRLKKKLGLNVEDSLYSFVHAL